MAASLSSIAAKGTRNATIRLPRYAAAKSAIAVIGVKLSGCHSSRLRAASRIIPINIVVRVFMLLLTPAKPTGVCSESAIFEHLISIVFLGYPRSDQKSASCESGEGSGCLVRVVGLSTRRGRFAPIMLGANTNLEPRDDHHDRTPQTN